MYGEDKSTIVELQNTVYELEGLKIEILEKSEKLNEINASIEKMEAQIKQIDEKLLEKMEANDNIDDLKIVFDEDSNFDILVSNIEILEDDVDEAVKKEAERKAEEERKAKEEAERKAVEERKAKEEAERKAVEQSLANVTKGDFTYFAGTYYNEYNPSETLVLDKNGKVTIAGRVFTNKPISIVKESTGAYWCLTKSGELTDDGFNIYPIGVSYGGSSSTNKVRLVVLESMGATPYIKN